MYYTKHTTKSPLLIPLLHTFLYVVSRSPLGPYTVQVLYILSPSCSGILPVEEEKDGLESTLRMTLDILASNLVVAHFL